MSAASHKELADQKLAAGQITARQYEVLRQRFFPDEGRPQRLSEPTTAPFVLHPWELPLVNPVTPPGVEPPKPADPFAIDLSTVTSEQLNAMFAALQTK